MIDFIKTFQSIRNNPQYLGVPDDALLLQVTRAVQDLTTPEDLTATEEFPCDCEGQRPDTSELLPLEEYDRIVVCYSGGKDSTACLLHMLETLRLRGVDPRTRIELWHHDVDGGPGNPAVFDWPITTAYCRAVATSLRVPIYMSWRDGGLYGELMKEGRPTHPVSFDMPNGLQGHAGGGGEPNNRLLFPLPVGDMHVRWCTPTAKVEVGRFVLTSDPRFARDVKVLFITGERREESTNRKKLARVEVHARDARKAKNRRVDHYRPILGWKEDRVWSIAQRWGIVPHPCYFVGYGRCSCEICVFGEEPEWASLKIVHPERYKLVVDLEAWTGKTIKMDRRPIPEWASDPIKGVPFPAAGDPVWRPRLLSTQVTWPTVSDPREWVLPPGAFRKGGGPV